VPVQDRQGNAGAAQPHADDLNAGHCCDARPDLDDDAMAMAALSEVCLPFAGSESPRWSTPMVTEVTDQGDLDAA